MVCICLSAFGSWIHPRAFATFRTHHVPNSDNITHIKNASKYTICSGLSPTPFEFGLKLLPTGAVWLDRYARKNRFHSPTTAKKRPPPLWELVPRSRAGPAIYREERQRKVRACSPK